MADKIRGALALTLLVVACGDGGDDEGGGPMLDAGQLTLEEALVTEGINTSNARAEVLFPAACKKGVPCTMELESECQTATITMYKAGKSAGFDDACLDATLDMYACYAQNECTDYEAACTGARTEQQDACAKYLPGVDSGS